MPIVYDDKGMIKRPNLSIQFTNEMVAEYVQCVQDVKYFAEKYYSVVHQVEGAQIIKLRDYQKEMLDVFVSNKIVLLCAARQIGKCVHMDTLIEVRNKNSGEIKKITIYELFQFIKNINTLS